MHLNVGGKLSIESAEDFMGTSSLHEWFLAKLLTVIYIHVSLGQGLNLKLLRGPNYDAQSNPRGRNTTLTQQWRYLNLTRSTFYILFPGKCIVSYR